MKRKLCTLTMLVAAFAVAAWAQPVSAARFIEAKGPRLELEVHQGRVVRLDRPAASVFIADPEIADVQVKSPQIVYVFGKTTGETTLFAVDEGEQVLAGIPISISHNLGKLRETLRAVAPATEVGFESVNGSLVLTGTARSASEAEDIRRLAATFVEDEKKIINQMRVFGPSQINLRVRVAEMKREVIKQVGVNWDAIARFGDFAFGLSTGRATTTGLFPGSSLSTRVNGTNAVFGGVRSSDLDLNALVDALESEGLIAILAEPNLTALTGEQASFLAGGEFPIPVPQGNETISIEYKKFGVSLTFTPTILGDGRINMRVFPEVSQLTSAGSVSIGGFTIPALTTRRAETTVELASGQSFAIAGLLQRTINTDVSKFPGLGDLPVLGALFRSNNFQNDETELVIIVTPYIVRPVSRQVLATPLDGYVVPTDAERIYGKRALSDMHDTRPDMNRPNTTPAFPTGPALAVGLSASNGGRLVGPTGFMLE